MKISDLLSLSFENLRRRIGRTSLTIIGVIVGTCSIVVMVSLGIAMNVGFDEMLQQWGDLTKIDVYNWGGGGETPPVDDAIVKSFSEIDHVTVATPIYNARYLNAKVFAGDKDRYEMSYAQIVGVYPEAIEMLGYTLRSGEYLTDAQTTGTIKQVPILMGENAGYSFTDTKKRNEDAYRYPGQTDMNGNPLAPFVDIATEKMTMSVQSYEEDAKAQEYYLDVQGVMVSDYSKGYITDSGILMDLNLLKKLEADYIKANKIDIDKNNNQGYDEVTVKVDDFENVEKVEEAIQDMGYSTYSLSSERDRMQEQSQMIQMILGGLGAVSLFVAALSIANTMTMAIYERTREIGVMKVLGCKLGKIRLMFLMEAAMIGFVGGLLGVGVSYAMSMAMNYFGPILMNSGMGNFLPMYGSKISVIPAWLAIGGIVFSTVIGILSGAMPANRAVKISALEAIRHE